MEAIKHSDTRKNIPTEELRDFMPDEPLQAKLDPRDASLDPQLVWKGDGRSVLSVQRHHKDIQESRSGPYKFEGEAFYPSNGRHWSLDPSTGMEMDRLANLGRLRKAGDGLRSILLTEDNPTTPLDNVWMDTGTGSFTEDQVYVVQTTTTAIERCLLMTTKAAPPQTKAASSHRTPNERHSPKNFVVEIKGVDVYDPTTGEIRSHSTDDIACWFIGTNYDGKRFFVRHADFTGADQPFDKLKRALKADIDEAAWSALYFNHQPAVPRATQGQDRREGHQPLRRRSIEGLLGEVPWRSFTR